MKEWARAPFSTLCGGCGTQIRKGAVYLVLKTNNAIDRDGNESSVAAGARLKRCQSCALNTFGEQPTAVVEDAVIVPQPSFFPGAPPTSQPFAKVGSLQRAWTQRERESKQLASGED